MSELCVYLFGRLQLRQGEQTIKGLEARKAQELFCYLLLHGNRPRPREYLANLICPDCLAEQSRKSLRQALWELQTAFNASDGPCSDEVIVVDAEWLQIRPGAPLMVDVRLFEDAFSTVQNLRGETLGPEDAATVRSATDLYLGDLLEGWYQDWCLLERERLQVMYLAMLDKLMAYSEAHGEYESGLVYAARSLRVDRARERTHQRAMRLHYLAGDRAGALRQWQSCVAALHDELGVMPSSHTVALHEQIRNGVSKLPELVDALAPHPPPLSRIQQRLVQIHAHLIDLQHEVEEELLSLSLLDGSDPDG